MKKALLTGVAALFLATGTAHAYYKKVRAPVLPPHKYGHLYEGRIKIIHFDEGGLPCRSRSLATRLGCAYLEDPDEKENLRSDEIGKKECLIYLASREEIEEAGYTESALLRHEMAHYNGWKGYRALGQDWID